ncbi:energy transducer TonB [Stenotrophomonas pavanii]|uniref:energy transducer TonB family protein n=1 Tax=Stenotrophomonas pavanii TaxID=487698 RepID=UPI002ACEDF70|nr:energy transducer TonB [Stenotrophomonas pavanii]MDZ7473534.1 energy transducer TonB [Stenotrophomonas pavanii]
MSERRQHWQAIAISIGLHLLPLLLLIHWVATPPLPPPAEQDVRISLRLLAPATPPQPVEERQADAPSQAQQARASRPTRSPPPPKPTTRHDGELAASARGGSGEHALPPAPAAAVTDTPPAQASITAAPPTPDAPPADIQAGAASDQWDARLMARLERYRYYPAAARARRQQGTAWVRASIGRTGRLLSLRLEQSSGQPELDAAALQTFRRAQPLPPIPDELKAPQERVVPVEYYLR